MFSVLSFLRKRLHLQEMGLLLEHINALAQGRWLHAPPAPGPCDGRHMAAEASPGFGLKPKTRGSGFGKHSELPSLSERDNTRSGTRQTSRAWLFERWHLKARREWCSSRHIRFLQQVKSCTRWKGSKNLNFSSSVGISH